MAVHKAKNMTPPLGDENEILNSQKVAHKKDEDSINGDVCNNTLYFINKNLGKASEDEITEAVIGRFSEVQVETAKITLLAKYEDVLKEIDPERTAEIKKPRRGSYNRAAAYPIVRNIIEALLMLDAHSKVINIVASKAMDDTLINPEALSGKAMLTRFIDIERRLINLEQENKELRTARLADKDIIDKLKTDITDLQNTNSALLTSIHHVSAGNSPLSAPVTAIDLVAEVDDVRAQNNEPTVGGNTLTPATPRDANAAAASSSSNRRQHRQQKPNAEMVGSLVAAHMGAAGAPVSEAVGIANNIGKSYAKITDNGAGGNPPYTDQFPPLGSAQQRLPNQMPKKKLSQISPSTKSTRTANDIRLAAPKPDWLTNKTLVIRGFDKGYINDKGRLLTLITKMASDALETEVEIRHMEILSKVHSPWLTIAIELSEAAFDALYNGAIWEEGLYVRPFLGRRFWRMSKQLTKAEMKRSVRMSWST